jgi:TAT (twin-arginine translocation) pathway signal sequence
VSKQVDSRRQFLKGATGAAGLLMTSKGAETMSSDWLFLGELLSSVGAAGTGKAGRELSQNRASKAKS